MAGRPAIKLDFSAVQNKIADLEVKQSWKSLKALFDEVAAHFDCSSTKIIQQKAIWEAGGKVLHINTKPGQRGKAPVDLPETKLRETLTALESAEKFSGQTTLFERAAKELGVSLPTIINRVKQFKIEVSTPKGQKGSFGGRRGRVAGQPIKKKRGLSLDCADYVLNCTDTLDETIEKAEKGNPMAAIKIKCLDCCGMSPGRPLPKKEVALCRITKCANWGFRPYGIRFQNELNGSESETEIVEIN